MTTALRYPEASRGHRKGALGGGIGTAEATAVVPDRGRVDDAATADSVRALAPAFLFERAAGLDRLAFLDGRGGSARSPLSHVAWAPASILRIDAEGRASVDGRRFDGDPLEVIEAFQRREARLGRTVIGVLGYELRRWIEPRTGRPRHPELPVAALSSYERCHTFDHTRGSWLIPPPTLPRHRFGKVRVSRPRPSLDRPTYRRLFDRVQEALAAGEIYQANLSMTLDAEIEGDPAALYERLVKAHPSPYGAYLDFGDFQVLSISPELFLARRGSMIRTRPIKGTRPRGEGPLDDARLADQLRRDPKERAEHVMIVDLERNDLGRISRTGSVRVTEFQVVESYPTLHHLESTVQAELPPGTAFSEIFRATFPGGSITGAPKIRAMQILAELEPEPRGFYTGTILHYPPEGDFTMSICIRTATVHRGRIRYGVGGGIVADSRVEAEYAECLLKARALFAAAAGVQG